MTKQEIDELIARFERSSLQTLKVSGEQFSIEMTRSLSPSTSAVAAESAETVPPQASEAHAITAPMVGTFYSAPAPDQPPFVAVGSQVQKGATVCLMEAMKMMSEVPAPCDCIIEEIVKENGQLAAFGEVLIRYRPC